jgi:hypothetical protein
MSIFIFFIIALLVIGLGAFDAAAITWGEDSRDQLPDDHHR